MTEAASWTPHHAKVGGFGGEALAIAGDKIGMRIAAVNWERASASVASKKSCGIRDQSTGSCERTCSNASSLR